MKYDKQKCPTCEKEVVTLYKTSKDDIGACYWCFKKHRKRHNKRNKPLPELDKILPFGEVARDKDNQPKGEYVPLTEEQKKKDREELARLETLELSKVSNRGRILVNLDRTDLLILVYGIYPCFSALEEPLVKNNGSYLSGLISEWTWDKHSLEKCTEEELLRIYQICKNRRNL